MGWRVDITKIDSLNDIDSQELMIHISHQFLEAAKDLVNRPSLADRTFAQQCSETAERIHDAIVLMYGD